MLQVVEALAVVVLPPAVLRVVLRAVVLVEPLPLRPRVLQAPAAALAEGGLDAASPLPRRAQRRRWAVLRAVLLVGPLPLRPRVLQALAAAAPAEGRLDAASPLPRREQRQRSAAVHVPLRRG